MYLAPMESFSDKVSRDNLFLLYQSLLFPLSILFLEFMIDKCRKEEEVVTEICIYILVFSIYILIGSKI